MKTRIIDIDRKRYFILDEYKADVYIKPDILIMRESDGEFVIAHGWNEAGGTWNYADYYGNCSESLLKAASDFKEIRNAYMELNDMAVLETYCDDYIDPRDVKKAVEFVRDSGRRATEADIYNLKLDLIKEYFDSLMEYDSYDVGSGIPSRLYIETMAYQFELEDYIDMLNDKVSRDYRPIARIPSGTNRNLFVCQLDENTQENIKRALTEKEIYEGYGGPELEALVDDVMKNRLSSIEESLTIVEV